MQTQDYPLIFIVEENSAYNKLITSNLMSKKNHKIECFSSGEECMKSLYKKPDIVIQDYLMNEISDNKVIKASHKNNLDTKFILLSGLDNFSKKRHQKTEFVSLSESEKFNFEADTIKCDDHDYVVKDMIALKKLINDISKVRNAQQINLQKSYYSVSLPLFLITVASLIMSLVGLVMIFPKAFSF